MSTEHWMIEARNLTHHVIHVANGHCIFGENVKSLQDLNACDSCSRLCTCVIKVPNDM